MKRSGRKAEKIRQNKTARKSHPCDFGRVCRPRATNLLEECGDGGAAELDGNLGHGPSKGANAKTIAGGNRAPALAHIHLGCRGIRDLIMTWGGYSFVQHEGIGPHCMCRPLIWRIC